MVLKCAEDLDRNNLHRTQRVDRDSEVIEQPTQRATQVDCDPPLGAAPTNPMAERQAVENTKEQDISEDQDHAVYDSACDDSDNGEGVERVSVIFPSSGLNPSNVTLMIQSIIDVEC